MDRQITPRRIPRIDVSGFNSYRAEVRARPHKGESVVPFPATTFVGIKARSIEAAWTAAAVCLRGHVVDVVRQEAATRLAEAREAAAPAEIVQLRPGVVDRSVLLHKTVLEISQRFPGLVRRGVL